MKNKLTKRDVYAQHGIIYDTKTDKIYHSVYGWIKPLLKEGNTKTGKRVKTFSLPAGTNGTCVCDCPNCYAKTGFYMTSSVRDSLALNMALVESDLDFVSRAIRAQIIAEKITMARIHAAGDFHTKNMREYAQMWADIVNDFPKTRFWTYTKISEYESLFDSYENASIVRSILPYNIGLNYGTCEYLLDAYKLMRAHGITPHICSCGYNDKQHCENCTGCSQNKYVLFLLHSTKEYDAKKDPMLSEIGKIIGEQA